MIKLSIEPCKVPIPEVVSDWLIKRAYIGIKQVKQQDDTKGNIQEIDKMGES